MKKYSSYIIFLVIIAALVAIWQPWKKGRNSGDEGNGDGSKQENVLPPEDSDVSLKSKSKICIYMENSGSMDGYVNLNSEFKDALGKIIVKSNSFYPNTHLFFVNNEIYDVENTALKGDVNNFVAQLNSATMKIGSTGSSNINQIFKLVLDRTDKETISILFSDFVYSIQGTDVSSQVANAKNATMGAFLDAIKKDPNFATIILKCKSQFKGKYYNRSDKPFTYTGERPYYIFIMGSYDRLKEIDNTLSLDKSTTGIPGLTNKYFLSSKSWTLTEDNIQALTTSYTNSDLIKPERNGMDIDFIKYNKDNGGVSFGYAMGLKNLFVDGSYLQDISNYEIDPQSARIIKAEFTTDEVAKNEVIQFNKPFVLQFNLENTDLTNNIKIRLLNKLPKWVHSSSISDDIAGVPEPTQTFAIASLLEGVYEAFNSQMRDKPLFEVELKINNYKK